MSPHPVNRAKTGRGQARKHGHLDPAHKPRDDSSRQASPKGEKPNHQHAQPLLNGRRESPRLKFQASSSRQGHQAHARVVRVVDPCAPGTLHPKRVRKSNRERRYLAFFEIIGQSRLSKRLAIRRFGRKLAQAQIRTNGRGIVAA